MYDHKKTLEYEKSDYSDRKNRKAYRKVMTHQITLDFIPDEDVFNGIMFVFDKEMKGSMSVVFKDIEKGKSEYLLDAKQEAVAIYIYKRYKNLE